jgi:2-iminobutanoate/2-iminopropanoate deaminase
LDPQPFFPAGLPAPRGPYSPAVIAGGLVFVSGQIPIPPEGTAAPSPDDLPGQARLVLGNLRTLLEEAGSSLSRVIRVTVFLADIADATEFNQVYSEFFPPPCPSRSTVQAGIPGGFLLELDAIAAI